MASLGGIFTRNSQVPLKTRWLENRVTEVNHHRDSKYSFWEGADTALHVGVTNI